MQPDPDDTPLVAPGPTPGEAVPIDVGQLFDQHAAYLLRVAQRLTGSAQVAEDLVQDAFIVAHRRRHELKAEHSVRTWLYRVVVNQVRHHRRSHARYWKFLSRFKIQELSRTGQMVDRDVSEAQQAQLIRRCVVDLPLKQREVFVLYELEEIEGAEIARILDIPVNTVWSRLRLARNRFRKLWTARYGSGGAS